MPLIMVSPFLGLLVFYILPFGTALSIYTVILIVAAFYNIVMIWSMRAKAKTGLETMIGEQALVIKNIDPEGKVEINGEIWRATARNQKITAGQRVTIVDAQGLLLIVKGLHVDPKH